MRFLSWECWDFWRRHNHFQRFPKKSEVFRSLRTHINTSSLPVLFTSKIRDREEGMVIYLLYTWFSFLTWVWVNIFFRNCMKQDGNNSHFSIRREKLACEHESAWDWSFQPTSMRLVLKAWELAGILFQVFQWMTFYGDYRVISKGFAGLKVWIFLWGFGSKRAFCMRWRKIGLFLEETSNYLFFNLIKLSKSNVCL